MNLLNSSNLKSELVLKRTNSVCKECRGFEDKLP